MKQDRLCKAEDGKMITALNCGRIQTKNQDEGTQFKCGGCEHQGCEIAVGRFDRWCKRLAKEYPPGVNPYFSVRLGNGRAHEPTDG